MLSAVSAAVADDHDKLLPSPRPLSPRPPSAATAWLHLAPALAGFLAADRLLEIATRAVHITFPSSLIGMFSILAALLVLDASGRAEGAAAVVAAASPAVVFLARWLPIFYVPPLVVLPLAVQGHAASELARCGLIVLTGMPASLFAAAAIVTAVRRAVTSDAGVPSASPFQEPHAHTLDAYSPRGRDGLLRRGRASRASSGPGAPLWLVCGRRGRGARDVIPRRAR